MLPIRLIKGSIALSRRCLCTHFQSDSLESNENFIISKQKRILKVAILGAPNAGKSTLINKIIGLPVLCVSKKVHTTRKRDRAAAIRDNVQILFVDTPGLVSRTEMKKFQLEPSFREDALRAMREAHVVGVVHDAANVWTRDRFDRNVIEILNALGSKEVFLVLNKVDEVKAKKTLLDLVQKLTSNGVSVPKPNALEVDLKPRPRVPWSNFSEIFMISALKGDGINDLVDYLVSRANEGKWFLPPGKITDKSWPMVLKEIVRGRLMDALPQEVPYSLIIETEYFHINDLGEVISVVLVTCPILRHQKMILAGHGRIIRQVATLAEADAKIALRTNVRLRIVVTTNPENNKL